MTRYLIDEIKAYYPQKQIIWPSRRMGKTGYSLTYIETLLFESESLFFTKLTFKFIIFSDEILQILAPTRRSIG